MISLKFLWKDLLSRTFLPILLWSCGGKIAAGRRPNQGPRKVYRPRYTSSNDGNPSTSTSDSVTSDTEGQDSNALDDWDELFLED